MLTNTTSLLAQADVAAQAADPNWTLIIILGAVFVILVIFLLKPLKDKKAIDGDSAKALTGNKKAISASDDVNLENYEEKKEQLSLAEIKAAKRQTADEMSKEELRELRKERRAATQTEKAVKEHDDSEEKLDAEANADKVETSDASEQANKPVNLDDVITKSDADTGDVFSSLFGDASDDLSFGDDFGSDGDAEDDGTVIPTLGSALIPLDQLLKAAEEEGKSEKEALTDLSIEFPPVAPAEKKTLN